jgi:hypothetical protein
MTAADIYHPGVPRTLKRVDAGLVGWMAHQFELLAAGRVWDDLGYRSQGNDFTAHLNEEPSPWNTAKARQYADRKQKQTAHVERMREQGIEIGTISGLSKKGDAEIYRHIKRAP